MFYKNIFKSKSLKVFLALIVLTGFVFGLILKTEANTCSDSSSPQFNIYPNDEETLRLKNRTQGDPEWKDPVSANPGDKIGFAVYYHNGVSNSVAKNTKIRLDFPEYLLDSQIVTMVYLWADNACYVSDTGTINVSAPQKLVFEETAKWYPNRGTIAIEIPIVEIKPSSIMVEINDIQGNWAYQGYVVFEARLEPAPVPSVDLKADGLNGPITVPYLTNVNLSWTSQNAVSCLASGDWSGQEAVSGFRAIQMNQVKTYTFNLACKDSTGTKTATDSVTVNVTPGPPTVITKPAVITY